MPRPTNDRDPLGPGSYFLPNRLPRPRFAAWVIVRFVFVLAQGAHRVTDRIEDGDRLIAAMLDQVFPPALAVAVPRGRGQFAKRVAMSFGLLVVLICQPGRLRQIHEPDRNLILQRQWIATHSGENRANG